MYNISRLYDITNLSDTECKVSDTECNNEYPDIRPDSKKVSSKKKGLYGEKDCVILQQCIRYSILNMHIYYTRACVRVCVIHIYIYIYIYIYVCVL